MQAYVWILVLAVFLWPLSYPKPSSEIKLSMLNLTLAHEAHEDLFIIISIMISTSARWKCQF